MLFLVGDIVNHYFLTTLPVYFSTIQCIWEIKHKPLIFPLHDVYDYLVYYSFNIKYIVLMFK